MHKYKDNKHKGREMYQNVLIVFISRWRIMDNFYSPIYSPQFLLTFV